MAPEISANAGFSYDGELTDPWMWGLGGDILYSDEYNASAMGHPYGWRDRYTLVNAMAYVGAANWQVKLLGKNLSNEMVRDGPHSLYRDWADISGFLYDEPSAQERNDEKIKTESFAGIQGQGSLSRFAGRPHHGGVGLPAAGR